MKTPRWPLAALIAASALTGAWQPLRAAGADGPAADARLTFALRDTGGRTHTSASLSGARAVVLFFITPDCPISQSYVPEMNRIAQAYAARGVRVYAVQSDVAVPDADVRQHVREFGYSFPVLLDPAQTLVRHTGATITPETAVMTAAGALLYRGRIDNRIVSLSTRRIAATSFELRNALDAAIAGTPVAVPRTTAFGCIITRRKP
jgi:thiol-disulfide isomerase/thioredoxin